MPRAAPPLPMEHEPSSSSHGPWHEEPAGETATSSTAPEERGVIRVSLSPSVSVSRELFPCGLEPPDTEASEEEPPPSLAGTQPSIPCIQSRTMSRPGCRVLTRATLRPTT